MKTCTTIVLLAGLVLFTAVTTAAGAAAEERYPEGTYREQVEPICKAMSERGAAPFSPRRLMKGYRPAQASALLRKTGQALLWGHRQLAAVQVPPELQSQVDEWLSFVGATAARYLKAARALAQGHLPRGEHLLRGLTVPPEVKRTEDALEFRYCAIEPRGWVPPIRPQPGD